MDFYMTDQLKRKQNSVQTRPMKHCAEYGDKRFNIHREGKQWIKSGCKSRDYSIACFSCEKLRAEGYGQCFVYGLLLFYALGKGDGQQKADTLVVS